MDIICFCSASVTIGTLKLHCFHTLRRWTFSVCVSVCMNVCETHPISLSDELLSASRGRVSAPYSADAAPKRKRKGGRGTSGAKYGSVGIPPLTERPIVIHLTFGSYHRKVLTGERREGGSLHQHHMTQIHHHHHHHHGLRPTQIWSTRVHVNDLVLARMFASVGLHSIYNWILKINMTFWQHFLYTDTTCEGVSAHVMPGLAAEHTGECVCAQHYIWKAAAVR